VGKRHYRIQFDLRVLKCIFVREREREGERKGVREGHKEEREREREREREST
jgi:hypothetical protein